MLVINKQLPMVEDKRDLMNHVWITHRGERIPVKEMSTLHIQRCIRCFEGKGNMFISPTYLGGKEKWLRIFNQELINRQ